MKINMKINMNNTNNNTNIDTDNHKHDNYNTKSLLTFDKIYSSCKRRIVWGSILAVLSALALSGYSRQETPTDPGTVTFTVVLLLFSLLLLYSGIMKRRFVNLFRSYVTILSADPTRSLEVLAINTGASVEVVKKNLQKMIKKNCFENAYIDFNQNRLVFPQQEQTCEHTPESPIETNPGPVYRQVTCNGCGAKNTVSAGSVAKCEYCGSTLT